MEDIHVSFEDIPCYLPLHPAVEVCFHSADLIGIHRDTLAVAGPMNMVHQVLLLFHLMVED